MKSFFATFLCLLLAACSPVTRDKGTGEALTGHQPTPADTNVPTVTKVIISPPQALIPKGVQQLFTATAIYSDGTRVEVSKQVSWSLSGEGKDNVESSSNAEGQLQLTGLKSGNEDLNIKAALNDPNLFGTANVITAELVSITVVSAASALRKGERVPIKAWGAFNDDTGADISAAVAWHSSSPAAIAGLGNLGGMDPGLCDLLGWNSSCSPAVAQSAYVTGVTADQQPVNIWASFAGITGNTVPVTVGPGLTSISLTPENYWEDFTLEHGTYWEKSFTFAAIGTYDDGSVADLTKQVTWYNQLPYTGVFSQFLSSETINVVTIASGGNSFASKMGRHITARATAFYPRYAPDGTMSYLSSMDSGEQGGIQVNITVTGGPSDSDSKSDKKRKVLCTELHRQGYLPDAIYEADALYGKTHIDLETSVNYHAWAVPVVRLMQQSPLLTQILRPAISAWAYQMGYLMGVYPTPNLGGELLMKYGVPVSNVVGKSIRYAQQL